VNGTKRNRPDVVVKVGAVATVEDGVVAVSAGVVVAVPCVTVVAVCVVPGVVVADCEVVVVAGDAVVPGKRQRETCAVRRVRVTCDRERELARFVFESALDGERHSVRDNSASRRRRRAGVPPRAIDGSGGVGLETRRDANVAERLRRCQ
jgi:hypothetical protein